MCNNIECPVCHESVMTEERQDHGCFNDHLFDLDTHAVSLMEDYGVIVTEKTEARELRL